MMIYYIIGIILIIGILLLIRSSYERRSLEVNEYTVTSDNLPGKFDSRVFVFLSDLHDTSFGKNNEELIEKIRKINPEAIFIGGDMTSSHLNSNHAPFAAFNHILEAFPDKMFYVIAGNHEVRIVTEERFGEWKKTADEILRRENVILLSDSFEKLCIEDESVLIGGMELDEKYYKKKGSILPLDDGYIEEHLGKARDEFTIVLCHSPLYIEELIEWGASLVLSGHFHGGTIRLPLLGGVMTPQYQFFSSFSKGMIQKPTGAGIISGGLGTHSINIRLNNKPDIVKIILKKEGCL